MVAIQVVIQAHGYSNLPQNIEGLEDFGEDVWRACCC